jgi:hypothetical protein
VFRNEIPEPCGIAQSERSAAVSEDSPPDGSPPPAEERHLSQRNLKSRGIGSVDYPRALCSEARGRRSSYAGGSASDQGDLVAEFARAIRFCDASAGAGAEARVCLSNIHCHRTLFFPLYLHRSKTH